MLKVADLGVVRGEGDNAFAIRLPALHLKQGEVLSIQGASGCGKSTLLELFGLILKPHQLGQFELAGRDIRQAVITQNERLLAQIRAKDFGFMLQSGGLLPFLKVQENLTLSGKLSGVKVDQNWLNGLIKRLSLGHLLQKYPKQLSIGERQRVSFLRAIAHKPKVLLADEPTAALDPNNAAILFDIIVDLVQENQLSALIVTHDWELAFRKKIENLTACIEQNASVFVRKAKLQGEPNAN